MLLIYGSRRIPPAAHMPPETWPGVCLATTAAGFNFYSKNSQNFQPYLPPGWKADRSMPSCAIKGLSFSFESSALRGSYPRRLPSSQSSGRVPSEYGLGLFFFPISLEKVRMRSNVKIWFHSFQYHNFFHSPTCHLASTSTSLRNGVCTPAWRHSEALGWSLTDVHTVTVQYHASWMPGVSTVFPVFYMFILNRWKFRYNLPRTCQKTKINSSCL